MMMMMLSLLAKRKPCSTILPIFTFSHPQIHRFCSSSSYKTPIFIVDYLISAFGFSSDKAAIVSKPIAHVKSPEKPDSVRHFLEHNGFTEDQIKTLVTCRPKILCSSIQNTLDPNLRALREMGLSNSALNQIILSDPDALRIRTAVSRIKFLKDFLGGSEASLVRACKNNRGLPSYDIAPKITLLQTHHGLSTHEVVWAVLNIPGFITCSIGWMDDVLTRTKELGFQPSLPMFVTGLQALSCNSREVLLKKMELLKSFGWSEKEFFSALRKCPTIVMICENNLQMKMTFLTKEARCDLPYIAYHPYLLTYSLEKRLRPRHHVLHLLESKGYSIKGQEFYETIRISNDKFMGRFIIPYKDDISGLHDTYLAACASEPETVFGKLKLDILLQNTN